MEASHHINTLGGDSKQPLSSCIRFRRFRLASSHSELISLSVQQSGITDADIDQLAKLTKLETLFLDNSKVTDAGLASLKALKKLKMLSIRGLAVSPQAVSEMQVALPGCRILR